MAKVFIQKRSFIALLIATALLSAIGSVQIANAASVSQSGVLFLKITPGARAGGMGESFVALSDDATATWFNPAGLAYIKNNELTLMHVNWLPQFKIDDLYYDFVSYVHQVDDWGTFGGNIIFLNLGETERRGENNEYLGTFSSYEFAMTGSYGATMSRNMSIGVNMRFIYSHLSEVGAGAEQGSGVATSVGVDVGWLWRTPVSGLHLGANLSNMGPKVAYIDVAQADPLPTNLKVGLAYHIVDTEYNRFTYLLDANKELVNRHDDGTSDPFYMALFTTWGADADDGTLGKSIIVNTGFEYWYSDLVALRAGYWHDELGKVKPMTFGASLKYHLYRFDFSYVAAGEGHPLTDTMRFSLSIGF
ncbi:PorV/PorQ family protein [bacterium]|nr:PorV/PorQ family protein [bacterium]